MQEGVSSWHARVACGFRTQAAAALTARCQPGGAWWILLPYADMEADLLVQQTGLHSLLGTPSILPC